MIKKVLYHNETKTFGYKKIVFFKTPEIDWDETEFLKCKDFSIKSFNITDDQMYDFIWFNKYCISDDESEIIETEGKYRKPEPL